MNNVKINVIFYLGNLKTFCEWVKNEYINLRSLSLHLLYSSHVKPIHPPDNDSMSLEGTEPFGWTDHWICAAWLTVNQYLTPTLGQDGGDRTIQHRANYYLMKACPGLGCKQNQYKTEVLCLGCWGEPLQQQQHSPHSETRPRHTRYGNSCIRKFCKWCLFSTWFHFFIT